MTQRVALLAILLLAGCDDRASAPPDAAPPDASAVGPETRAAPPETRARPAPSGSALSAAEAARALPAGEVLRVVVDEPGAPPRQRLSHAPAAGERARLSIEANLMSAAGGSAAQQRLVFVVDAEVTAAGADGIALTFTVREAAPEAAAAGDAPVQRLVGATARWRVDRRGGWLATPPPALDDAGARQLWATLGDALRDAIPPLPDSAVGAGARWTASDRIFRAGVALLRTSRVWLEDAGAETLRIKADVSEQPLAGGPRDPAAPADMAFAAHAGMGAGARRIAWQPGKLWPLAADSQAAVDLRIEVTPLGDAGVAPHSDDVRITQVLTLLKEP